MELNKELKTEQERLEEVREICDRGGYFSPGDLTAMADYLLFTSEPGTTPRERKKPYPFLTSNRLATIDKRESSLDNLSEAMGDAVYALMESNPGTSLLDPKEDAPLLAEDRACIKSYLDIIARLSKQLQSARGNRKFMLKKQIIETYQQIVIVRESSRPSCQRNRTQIKTLAKTDLSRESIFFDSAGNPYSDAPINLYNHHHVSYLLSFMPDLRWEVREDLSSDLKWLLEDLDALCKRHLPPHWAYLVECRQRGMTGVEVEQAMLDSFGLSHSAQYWSALFRRRIPKFLVRKAQEHYVYHYWRTTGYGTWQKCSKCGKTKPVHPYFFTTNGGRTYSICRECRLKKGGLHDSGLC